MYDYILIDYFNLPSALLRLGITGLVESLHLKLLSRFPDWGDTLVRLYGGWYNHAGLTRDGTLLVQDLTNDFPLIFRSPDGKIQHVRCEIASSLLRYPGELFVATFRPRHGMQPFLKQPPPGECVNPNNCTISTVIHWSRKGCPTPGCAVSSQDAFQCNQQKLVDTLLCCDLITLSADSSNRIFVVSEDDDFIPALLLARAHSADIWHVRTKPSKDRLYDKMMMTNGVNLFAV